MRLRARFAEGITTVQVLIQHPMENGLRKDAQGRTIPEHFVTEVTASHDDRVVLMASFGRSVSTNPLLQFEFEGGAVGDTIAIRWVDSAGDTRSDAVQIT